MQFKKKQNIESSEEKSSEEESSEEESSEREKSEKINDEKRLDDKSVNEAAIIDQFDVLNALHTLKNLFAKSIIYPFIVCGGVLSKYNFTDQS